MYVVLSKVRKYFRTFVQRYSRQGYTYCTRVHVSMCTTSEGVQYVVARTSCVDLITKRLRVQLQYVYVYVYV